MTVVEMRDVSVERRRASYATLGNGQMERHVHNITTDAILFLFFFFNLLTNCCCWNEEEEEEEPTVAVVDVVNE